jgi:hypothetical protein
VVEMVQPQAVRLLLVLLDREDFRVPNRTSLSEVVEVHLTRAI